jgi:hypothetical protein
MKLFVRYTEKCIEDYWDGKEYGDWHQEFQFSVHDIGLSSLKKWGALIDGEDTIEVPFECDIGDKVYVLVMIYSTGDSFGHADGRGEIIYLFKDKALANAAYEEFLKACNKTSEAYNVEIKVDGGATVELHNPAYGYFEHLEDLRVVELEVNP